MEKIELSSSKFIASLQPSIKIMYKLRTVQYGFIIQKKMSKYLGLLCTLAMLLYCGSGLNWQGTGNMSQQNMTEVWTYIDANFNKAWAYNPIRTAGDTKLVDFMKGLSDHLNTKWDPAWNVVAGYVYSYGIKGDTILYGYAFRDHWLWYNQINMDDGGSVSLVIWKDYNCITWMTFNYNTRDYNVSYPGSYSVAANTVIKNAVLSLKSTLSQKEPWLAAQSYSQVLSSNSDVKNALGSDYAFTVVLSQIAAELFGYFCVKDYFVNAYSVGFNPQEGSWGRAMVLQMR